MMNDKKELQKNIDEMKVQLQEMENRLDKMPEGNNTFFPKIGSKCWYITTCGMCNFDFDDTTSDLLYLYAGNCFKTEEEANKSEINKFLAFDYEYIKFIHELNDEWEPDFTDKINKYVLYINTLNNSIEGYGIFYSPEQHKKYYCKDELLKLKAIKNFGESELKWYLKYKFGII